MVPLRAVARGAIRKIQVVGGVELYGGGVALDSLVVIFGGEVLRVASMECVSVSRCASRCGRAAIKIESHLISIAVVDVGE